MMKNIQYIIIILISLFAFGLQRVSADSITFPIVSIGAGNGNTPENVGPVSGSSNNGDVPVYATITDTDLSNYHFRVVKDGGVDGYTCTDLGALFAPENQGYASTTLSKDACGFVFNQSVYFSNPSGFTNSLIATLNTSDIIAYSGEGEYWLILGAVDTAGNRSNSNYLNDPKVKITVTSAPVVTTTTTPSPVTPSGSGGGNGPIVNSYGVAPSGFSPAVVANNNLFKEEAPKTLAVSAGNTSESTYILADGGIPANESVDLATSSDVSANEEKTDNSKQLAQVVSSGFGYNWLWLVVFLIVVGIIYYFSRSKK